jgi:hypothetical protein
VTLEELENTLPNGLHDAEVRSLAVDYEQRKMTLDVAVWVGLMDDPPERREAYKKGRIEISGLIFFVMEPPDPTYPFRKSSKLTIDGCNRSENLDRELVASVPGDAFFRSLWVDEWNAFIHIAARDAQIAWLDDGAVTYR